MGSGSIDRTGRPVPVFARNARFLRAAKLACGTALTVALLGGAWVQPASAQDDTITLTAGGSTLTVSPGMPW